MTNVKQIKASGALQIIRVNAAGTALEVEPGLTIATGGAIQSTGVGTGSVNGNARGTGAIDLQNNRSAATGVASGINSFVTNQFNTAAGRGCAVFGNGNTCQHDYALMAGNSGQSRYQGSIVLSSGAFSYADAQAHQLLLRGVTTDATQTELVSPARLTMPTARAVGFSVHLVGRDTSSGQGAAYKFEGGIKRPGAANTTALVGTVTKTVLGEDNAAWDATIDADTTNGSLRVRVTGSAATTIDWVAYCQILEVG